MRVHKAALNRGYLSAKKSVRRNAPKAGEDAEKAAPLVLLA
jgi:hypothetical protein